MNREAEPINEIPRAIKTLPTMLIIRSLLSRFLTVASASFIYALSMLLSRLELLQLFPLMKFFLTSNNYSSSRARFTTAERPGKKGYFVSQ